VAQFTVGFFRRRHGLSDFVAHNVADLTTNAVNRDRTVGPPTQFAL
jgi:hypothetical protein